MEQIFQLLSNYPLIVAGSSWAAAQVLKAMINALQTKKFKAERLVGAGGMPSCHSAAVCGLMMALARSEGMGSPSFAVAVLLAIVVMYDAMGVRRAAGEQAKALNRLAKSKILDEEDPNILPGDLKEYLGHTPIQVLAGALLGIMIAIFIPIF